MEAQGNYISRQDVLQLLEVVRVLNPSVIELRLANALIKAVKQLDGIDI